MTIGVRVAAAKSVSHSSAEFLPGTIAPSPSGFLALLAGTAAQPEISLNAGDDIAPVQWKADSEMGATSTTEMASQDANWRPEDPTGQTQPQIYSTAVLPRSDHRPVRSSTKEESKTTGREPSLHSDSDANSAVARAALSPPHAWTASSLPLSGQEPAAPAGTNTESSSLKASAGTGKFQDGNTDAHPEPVGIVRDTKGSSDAVPLPAGGSQTQEPRGGGAAKGLGDGSAPSGSSVEAPTIEPSSAAGSVLANGDSVPVGVQAMPFSPAVRRAGSSDAPGLPSGASQNTGPGGAGPATGSDGVSKVGDGTSNQSEAAGRTPGVPAHNATSSDQTAQRPDGTFSRPAPDTPKSPNSSSPQTPGIALEATVHTAGTPASRSGFVPQSSHLDGQSSSAQTPASPATLSVSLMTINGIAVPVVTPSMMTQPIGHLPGLVAAGQSQTGTTPATGPGDGGPAKSSNDVGTIGDGKDNRSGAAARTAEAPAHSSTSNDQTAPRPDAAASKPAPDSPQAPNSISPQTQGGALQRAAQSVGEPSGHAGSVLQALRGEVAPPEQSSVDSATAAINSSSLIQKVSEAEMRIAVHSTEFGAISIRTSFSPQQVLAQITVDHDGLGSALSAHAPAMEARLGNELGVRTLVQVNPTVTSYSGGGGNSPQSGQRSFQAEPVHNENVTAPAESQQTGLHLESHSTDQSRLDIQA